jgi:hypothetical protein
VVLLVVLLVICRPELLPSHAPTLRNVLLQVGIDRLVRYWYSALQIDFARTYLGAKTLHLEFLVGLGSVLLRGQV